MILSAHLHAQKADQHFSGALEFGLGWGHAIDFTLDNNNFTSKYLFERLIDLPKYAGIHTYKPLSHDSYMEFGLVYHYRSSDWIYQRRTYNGFGNYSNGTSHMVLALNCIDFSLKYYKFLNHWKNREVYAFGGIAPVWILNVAYASDLSNNSVPGHCFRNWNLAASGGLTLEKRKIRWKLHFDLALVSVVNSDYKDCVPEDERAWGPYIFPFEALLCCAYLIR